MWSQKIQENAHKKVPEGYGKTTFSDLNAPCALPCGFKQGSLLWQRQSLFLTLKQHSTIMSQAKHYCDNTYYRLVDAQVKPIKELTDQNLQDTGNCAEWRRRTHVADPSLEGFTARRRERERAISLHSLVCGGFVGSCCAVGPRPGSITHGDLILFTDHTQHFFTLYPCFSNNSH